ncbi:MAG: alpha/beta fold hydrolase [Anaerolineales bacterium]|jgi:hypothetical protein|nr:alpha/beta fold hydrolase [Anaerolineales bacterium]
MKRILVFLTLACLAALLLASALPTATGQAQAPSPTPNPAFISTAEQLVTLLSQQQVAQAVQLFDPELAPSLPASELEKAWKSLAPQFGAFQGISESTLTRSAEADIVYVTTAFEKGSLDLKVIFNPAGRVIGFFFTPAGTGKAALAVYQPPAYSLPGAFRELEVTLQTGEYRLPGLLTLPVGNGPFPAVLLVHGSGPNDRDETIFGNKPFRDLAEGLASQRIAVLRYDKRTKVYSEQMAALADQITVQEEVIDDALTGLELLRSRPEIDPQRLYLLGHSLGGMLAPRIASLSPDLAGLIILAGPTRPLEDIVLDQVSYLSNLDGALSIEEQAQIDLLKEQAAQVKSPSLATQPAASLPLGLPAAYWLDLRTYQPAQTAAQLEVPVFILQGERDYQVTAVDFEGWKAALEDQPGVFLKQYPRLNHLFMAGNGPGTPQEYQKNAHVSELVIQDITDFVTTGQVSSQIPLLGGRLSQQEIIRLALLILPVLLIQIAISTYALIDLSHRQHTHGPRWLWAVLLAITLVTVPSGLVVSAIYLIWARKEEEEEEEGADDSN